MVKQKKITANINPSFLLLFFVYLSYIYIKFPFTFILFRHFVILFFWFFIVLFTFKSKTLVDKLHIFIRNPPLPLLVSKLLPYISNNETELYFTDNFMLSSRECSFCSSNYHSLANSYGCTSSSWSNCSCSCC